MNKQGATVLYDCIRFLEKSAVSFMMKWNREKERTCLSLFETNTPNVIEGRKTPLHLACSFPSLSVITDLICDQRTNALVLDSRLKLPSELVPENYLSSWKIIHKFELSKFTAHLSTPLLAEAVSDLQALDEQVSLTRIDNPTQHSGFDFDDAASSGPSSCSKYASTKKRKFMLDLVSLKGIGQQKNIMLQQPQTQAPHNSPKIEFRNIANSRLNLVRVAGIQNGSSQQFVSFKKTNILPQQPRRPSTELSLEDVMDKIAESKQVNSHTVKAIKFSIKSPTVFKTNLDISARRSLDPPSVFSDVSENVLDMSTANKSTTQKNLTNLISTSRISGSGMRKIQASHPTSASTILKSASAKKRPWPVELPSPATAALIERALLEISRLAKKLLSTAKLGLLKASLSESHIRATSRHVRSIAAVLLLSDSGFRELLTPDDSPLRSALRDCLSLLKELITSFAQESGAEIAIFKHTHLQLVREFSPIASLHSLLSHELSELFLGLKKRVNKLQDAASKSSLSSAELLLEAAVEVISVQAKMTMSPCAGSRQQGDPLSMLHEVKQSPEKQRRRTNPLRQNLAFPNSFFQRQQRDTSSTAHANRSPEQAVHPAFGSLQDSDQKVNVGSAGLS